MSDKKESKVPAKQENVDEELSDLLDSALEDFNKEPKTANNEKKDETKDVASGSSGNISEELDMDKIMQDFENNFGPTLQANMSPEEQETFKKITEAARDLLSNTAQVPEDSAAFATFIAEGLQQAGVQDPSFPNINLPLGGNEFPDLFKQMAEEFAQTVLRADVIYPAMTHTLGLYPEWLEANKDKISTEDGERYKKQMDLMQEVCTVLETEKEDDAIEVRVQRMEKVVNMMQKMQDLGELPPDLWKDGDLGQMPPMAALPNMSGLQQDQCNVM